jgi:hypothetical protein
MAAPSMTMRDFLSAVQQRCIMRHWCSRAPARSELGDGVGASPIAIEGSDVSTSVSPVVAQSSGGCVRGIGRLGSTGSVWEARWVRTLVNRLGGWGAGVK